MRIAVTDIGSNTVKTKIFVCDNNKIRETYSDVRNTKLISHIKDGALIPSGIALLCNDINSLKQNAEKEGYDHFAAFATASLRRTSNVEEIIKNVYGFCNVNIDLISGEDEAFLSFSGVKNTTENFPDNTVLFDMGGGSTEIVKCTNGNKDFSASMDFGSLSMHLDFPNNDFDSIKTKASQILQNTPKNTISSDSAILVGGTALAINTLYDHFFTADSKATMTVTNLLKLYETLKPYDEKVLKLLQEKVPHRVTTVIPGLAAFLGLFEMCGIQNVTVTKSGIREGYVTERILKNPEICK